MKQTALEFYRSNLMALVSTGKTNFKTEPEIFEQAKEMEKQQIIHPYIAGSISLTSKDEGEQYYKETYGK